MRKEKWKGIAEERNISLGAEIETELEHLKTSPVCEPDVHSTQSRFSLFDENSIEILQSFGYQCDYGPNICMLSDNILILVAGNFLSFLDITTKKKMFLPSVNGVGFCCVDAHPSGSYFAAAEKGPNFSINVFDYPSLKGCKTLKHEVNLMKTHLVSFNPEGEILISISDDPENKIFIWLWKQEYLIHDTPIQELKIYHLHFSTFDSNVFFTSGRGHIKLWSFSCTRDERDDIIALQLNETYKFTSFREKQITYCTLSLPDNNFVSGSEDGYLYFFHGIEHTEVAFDCKTIGMKDSLPCHNGSVNCVLFHEHFIITFGSDGFVKFWEFSDFFKKVNNEDNLETSLSTLASISSVSPIRESKPSIINTESKNKSVEKMLNYLSLGPVKSLSLSKKSNLVHAVLIEEDDTMSFLIQDLCGKLWKLNVSDDLSETLCSQLICGLGLNLTDMAMCPTYPLLAAVSKTGEIIIFDCTSNDVYLTYYFNCACTQVIWPDKKIDGIGASFIVGFENGMIYWLSTIGPDSKSIEMKALSKPHSDAVKCLSYNSACSVLVSQGLDLKLFFFHLENYNFTPIGFYINRHEVDRLEWILYDSSDNHSEPLHRLLIICKYSYMLEVDIPEHSFFNDDDARETFYIENNNCQIYTIDFLNECHVLGDRIEDSEGKEYEQMTEEGKELLRNLQYEEKKKKRENYWEMHLGKSSERMIPPKILAYLPSAQSGHTWLAFGKYDFGYIFEFALCQEYQQNPVQLKPVRALEILNSEWTSILSLQYSPCGKFLFMGLEDGSLNVCFLENAYEPSSGCDLAKYQIHDAELGQAQYVHVSSDGHFIVTRGGDGNIFLFKFNALQYEKTMVYENMPYINSSSNETEVMEVEDTLSLEEELKKKVSAKSEKSKFENLEELEILKNNYNMFLEDYNAYLNKCSSSIKGLDEIPDTLKIDTEIIPEKAVEIFEEDTKHLLQNVEKEFERESVRISIQCKIYDDFFKSRIESEKICFEYENNKLESYRECVFPMSCSDISDKSYFCIYGMKKEADIKDVKVEIQENSTPNKNLLALKKKLAATYKSLIHYSEDTPVLPAILKYNERKQECINNLQELICCYEQLENIQPDANVYNEAREQLETSFFKFKEKYGLEIIYPDIMHTFYEKKDSIKMFVKKIKDFQKQFNNLVVEACTHSNSFNAVTNEFSSSSESDKVKGNKLNFIDIHISNRKGQHSEVERVYPKIDWGSAAIDSKKSLVRKFSSMTKTSEHHSESISLDLKKRTTSNLWERKKLQAFHFYLQLMKSKMDCEKKFFDIRLNMKCIELNSLKPTLRDEIRCTKILEKFQMDIEIEEEELITVKAGIELLKDFRLQEKLKWKQLYDEMMKVVGRNHKHKGYFKQMFLKKSLSDTKTTYQCHSSSESSESEQDIEGDNDNQNFDLSFIDENIVEKVLDLRAKKEEVEKKMKTFKRKYKALTTKQNGIARKIQNLRDSMTDTFIEVDSMLSTRKKECERFKWPVILHPENLHEDYICNNQNHVAVEHQQMIDQEMTRINKIITAQVAISNDYVTSSVHQSLQVVVSLEINDLIDVVLLLQPLIQTVSFETDDYFQNVLYTPSSLSLKSDTSEGEEFNFIRNVLEDVNDLSSDTESMGSLFYEEDLDRDFEGLQKTFTLCYDSENEKDIFKEPDIEVCDFDLMPFIVKDDVVEESLSSLQCDINETEDSIKMDLCCSSGCPNCEAIVSTAISSIDYSELIQQNITPALDYYMCPFTYELRDINEWKRSDQKSSELVDSDVQQQGTNESGRSDEDSYECDDSDVEQQKTDESNRSKGKSYDFVDSDVEQQFPTFRGGGLVLTIPVLENMQEKDPNHFPYRKFYQKIESHKEEVRKVETVHIVPTRKKEMPIEYVLCPKKDFILVDAKIIRKILDSCHEMKEYTKDLEDEFQSLQKTLENSKRLLLFRHQALKRAQQDFDREILNKFSCKIDLDLLLDEIEDPEYLIRKYELEKELDCMRKELNELKAEEATALKSFDCLRFEDTKICFELLQLREEFTRLNKNFASKRKVLPKIGSITLEPDDESKL